MKQRQPGEDLFGEERGCMKLVDISIVKLTDEDTAKDEFQRMFEVNCVDGTQRIFLTETESQCDQWVQAIEQAMSNKFNSSHFVQKSSVSTATSSKEDKYENKGVEEGAPLGENEVAELKQAVDFDLGIHIITVASSSTGKH